MAYKYPFIPDKTMYAAVMGACSYIRETGYFNKAVKYYANKYGVDEDELAKHVRARQGAGQKGKSRQYKHFVVAVLHNYGCIVDDVYTFSSWEWTEDDYRKHTEIGVKKATSEQNVKLAIEKNNPWPYGEGDDYTVCKTWEYDSQAEAEKAARELTWDDVRQYVLPKDVIECHAHPDI